MGIGIRIGAFRFLAFRKKRIMIGEALGGPAIEGRPFYYGKKGHPCNGDENLVFHLGKSAFK
jgi:hypothetical protein